MAKLLKKDLDAFVAPLIKAVHRYVNEYCVQGMVKPSLSVPAGMVTTHNAVMKGDGATVEWEGFTIEFTCCRRARVVCNVPTPFSLFTFNYCLKRDGKQLAHGSTKPEFLTHAMRAVAKVVA